jgi:hypothetical protein
MAWDKLAVGNFVLNLLNKKSVNSLSDSGEFSDALERRLDLDYEKELAANNWRFATKTQALSVLVTPPSIDEWTYSLQIPSDYMNLVRVIPHVPYAIYGDKIYSNYNELKLEYRYKPDWSLLPAYFVVFLATKVAANMALAVANSPALADKLKADAMEQLAIASFSDAQAHPTKSIQSNPIISVRGGWGYYGDGGGY